MIGLDTNILVRYLAQDDPAQTRRATDLIEGLTEAAPAFVSIVVMVETVWVLDRAYGLGSGEIADTVERILQIGTLIVEDEQQIFTALAALRAGLGSFADAIIAVRSTKAGCSHTLTFDRKATRLPGFELL